MERRALVGDTEVAFEIVGSGPRLVWCHGLASCRDGDRDIVEAFAAGFTVLSYDARGHGRSEPVRDPARYSYAILARDLCVLLDHVGWERATLAGASMGAATAARVAALAPERAGALVMARPGAGDAHGLAPPWLRMVFSAGAAALRRGGIEAAIAFLLTIPQARAEIDADPGRLDALRRDWTRHDPVSIAAALEGVPQTSPLDGGLHADAIRCPTLIVPGNDLIHPTEVGHLIASLVPGSVVAAPFDSLPRDEEVAGFVALVREFLGRVHA